jgi:hypothetical protein
MSRLTEFSWLVIIVALWSFLALPTTRVVFNPQAVTIDGAEVTVLRDFPGDKFGLKRPMLSYIETVSPLTPEHNSGHFCQHANPNPIRYISKEPVGRWRIDWAEPCLDDPLGFTWEASWFYHLGTIRLGPVRLSTTVLNTDMLQP